MHLRPRPRSTFDQESVVFAPGSCRLGHRATAPCLASCPIWPLLGTPAPAQLAWDQVFVRHSLLTWIGSSASGISACPQLARLDLLLCLGNLLLARSLLLLARIDSAYFQIGSSFSQLGF
jgi:hypothetical protein